MPPPLRLEVEHDGQLHILEVEAGGGDQFVVRVGEHAWALDVRRVGDDTLSLRLPDGSTHLIVVERTGDAGERTVSVGGHRVRTALDGRTRRRGAARADGSGAQRVVAPMPGKVVRLLVAVGQQVEPRQPLVVVEAMKMENELSVTRAGRVADIQVTEGQSVEAGRLLVLVE